MQLAFIGLGVMGFPMAGHLTRNCHSVSVYNRTESKAKEWLELYGGHICMTPFQAAKNAECVFCCVGDDNDVREVLLGPSGVINGMNPGGVLVDHTTTSANLAKEIDQICRKKNLHFLDAPVSGGEIGAKKGTLTIMCGGEKEVYNKILQLLNCYAQHTSLMGSVGAGQLTKMVNQICIAGVLGGLSEGFCFAERAGLDIERVVDVISKGAAQSWQMENRYNTMKSDDYNHGFAVDWMRKDLGICLEEGKRCGVTLPLVALIDQFYQDVQNMGGGRWDTSSLLARLRKLIKK